MYHRARAHLRAPPGAPACSVQGPASQYIEATDASQTVLTYNEGVSDVEKLQVKTPRNCSCRCESLRWVLLGVGLADELDHSRVCQCGDVTQLVWLVLGNFAQDPPHDLSRTCLWEARHYLQGRGGGGGH